MSADVTASMVCDSEVKCMRWPFFLMGVAVGALAVAVILLRVGGDSVRLFLESEDDYTDDDGDDEDEREALLASFASLSGSTSVSMDPSETCEAERELLNGFDINVTTKVLSALREHLQNITSEQEVESLGKLHVSFEPSTKGGEQVDLSTVLRRWSETSGVSSRSASPECLRRKSCGCADTENTRQGSRRSLSISGSFREVDGVNIKEYSEELLRGLKFPHTKWNLHDGYDKEPLGEVKIEVVSEEGWFADDTDVMQAREFDERVLSKIGSVEESYMYLRRTRAVSMLSSRLMAAPDEKSCYEIVSRLLVPLFHVDRCSYVLMKDADNMVVKQLTVNKREHMVMGLDRGFRGGGRWVDGEVVKPLKGTAVELCSKTLKQYYCPQIKDSPFEPQRQISTMGFNTILATPILVNGNKFVGCIMICMVKEDAFNDYDRILISDVAAMLGANIYSKRMKHAADVSNKISREMLHSMIPPNVIDKISCFWDERSDEYRRRRSSLSASSKARSRRFSRMSTLDEDRSDINVGERINILSKMYRQESEQEEMGTLLETDETNDLQLSTTTKALFAENVDNVCILFADVVGFSRISLDLEPFVVVNMLQDLFSRFDECCDRHNVQKLETIGDAYICTAGIDSNSRNKESIKESAVRILNMAKDMVIQARHVWVPNSGGLLGKNAKLFDSLEIRVGIHVGNVTCGVLGQRLPKLTVFGNAVNLAARMEQASRPSHIRVTEEFHQLVADVEKDWGEYEEIEMKNMGTMGTYILNPLKSLHLM
ncbi:hypothetical protein HJC23_013608 [Cyclotella cryptica]|uniref:Guanylate cyclase domain-containing protein n=1 Tax=Cyclotella cryptica TaxID=29204 RepID=A0ABD3PQF7_9STRA|eukprot:CCRYP_012581-RA/>CCRYP_012581-RA protein AED:0.02 eAED:0.02 QI:614/1/1/1/1/1/3/500/772